MESNALAAGEFKATCLALMDEVAATGREVIITKRGKPVAKLVPFKPVQRPKSILGALQHLLVDPAADLTVTKPIAGYTVADNIRKWELRLAAERERFPPKVASKTSSKKKRGPSL